MAEPTQALKHELSCRYLQPILDLCDAEELAHFLGGWKVRLEDLRDQTNWVSLRFCESLTELAAARLGAAVLVERVTRAALSPRAMGFLYPLLRAFGSPRLGFPSLPRLVGGLNKVSIVEVRDIKRGSAEIEYRPTSAEYQERSPLICQVRRAQLAASPTIFGLPAAQIEEQECQANGAGRCLYQLRWAERAGFWGALVGALAGALAGWLLAAGAWLPLLLVAGAAIGRMWDSQQQIAELTRFNGVQTAALRDAAESAERRFVELERAKTEVDRQVEERTGELRTASAKLQESLLRLEELGRVKDEFVANVSHELRTPLTLILSPLEELLAGRAGSAEVTSDYLRAMHSSAVRLNDMVNDLLMLSRLQAGQLRLSVVETDLSELASGALEQFRALAEKRQVALRFFSDGPCAAWVDPGRVEFALINLLSNALKFTPAGGEVRLRVAAAESGLTVEVSDSGVGIPPERKARLFERFNRFEPPSLPGTAGAGIGLSLVKELVLLHGGQVAVTSEPGRGSTFTLTFRRGREHLADAPPERQTADVAVPFGRRSADLEPAFTEEPSSIRSTASEAPPDAPRILLVEDNAELRRFIVRVLAGRYRVTEAADGNDALARIAERAPDLVLSDVMMPGLNGHELCRRLKANLDTRLIPVVLLTAKKDRVVEGFQAGADDYLVKPFNAQELMARMDVHLRLRRLMRDRVHVEKLATLGSLAAGLAHEVRNPASAILSGLPKARRALDRPDAPPRALEMIDVAIDSAQRIANLVDDLLQLGQPDRQGARLWDLHEGIDAAIRILQERSTLVELRRDFSFRGRVRCRPDALNQVFLNLIDNAFRAVEKGGIVEVQTRPEEGGVSVLVADSGQGVPGEVAARIFDPFFTTRAGSGSGLGLHISQTVAVEHGGRLELVSREGWGACFKLWLPDVEGGSAA